MTPFDWQQTAHSCLSPGQYFLWKTEYKELAKTVIQKTDCKKTLDQTTISMLQLTEDYSSPQVQLSLPKTVLEEVSKLAIIAWK